MSPSLQNICRNHRDEIASLAEMLAQLPVDKWQVATPAPGWAIRDQVAHLAMFDERALWSIADPDRFAADRESLMSGGKYLEIHKQWALTEPTQLFQRWRDGAVALNDVATQSDPTTRCEWYGPPMSITSKMTARIMETWAHAHDVADALNVAVSCTPRLRHVAHIGVRSRAFAFATNSQQLPAIEPYVELHTPSGHVWTWGDSQSGDIVRGPALGFCQLVTQRRHIDDAGVTAEGEGAMAWMKIAQAFAGPPGQGRTPGQFTAAT